MSKYGTTGRRAVDFHPSAKESRGHQQTDRCTDRFRHADRRRKSGNRLALHVLIRHLKSPELLAELTTAFEQHQALMLQKPWPEQMLASFEATRRFLESAARNDNGPDAPGKAG